MSEPSFPKLSRALVDHRTGMYRLNHPLFLVHLLRCAVTYARETGGARWWQPKTWRFLAIVLRDRARANATGGR